LNTVAFQVEFAEKLYVTAVEIYETLNAGAVIKVAALDSARDQWISLWEADGLAPQCIQTSRCFTPAIKVVDISVVPVCKSITY
jgi:hypothetical protein